MQRRGAVEQDKLLMHHLFQQVPDNRVRFACALDEPLGRPSAGRILPLQQFADEERFEQFQAHPGWQTALVQRKLWVAHDHRPPGIIHALAQQMLAQVSLLAADGLRQASEPVSA